MRALMHAWSTRWSLPTQCEVCRGWAPERICQACVLRFAPAVLRCARCALPITSLTGACPTCQALEPAWTRALCAVDYGFPWDRLIQALKFQDRVELASPLARQLAGVVQAAHPRVDAVTAIPLSAARLAERGYNQAWELAWRVARELGLPAHAHWIQRPINSTHQTGLTRQQRLHNLRGAFMVPRPYRTALAGQRVALVDDVFTTGATLQEATLCLLRAGAGSVEVWTVARTV